MKTKQEQLIEYLSKFIGSRYQWAGEGGYNVGFDCSGFILEGLRAFGLWGSSDATSQGIYDKFKSWETSESVRCGDLVFFGKDKKSISHVAIAVDAFQFLECGGGGRETVDVGFVRLRPHGWRKDLVAVVRPRFP